MTLGSRVGPYEVVAPLGAGGMGEVYRARDTTLDRDVALKVLPASFADDPERIARLTREAKSLAALSHPHIAQTYGVEEGDGRTLALVMELVPGESLAARLERGPVPLRDALDSAQQIADGLGAAHEKGIIHRDLKPANLQVTPDGTVKILDFGLAKAIRPEAGRAEPGADVSTVLATMTELGSVLGTAPYMSPEQARGQVVDARTDIWAFGCVLFELLSGHRAFAGPTITDILAAVLEREPDWARLPPALPGTIRALVQRCLKKEARQRLHHITDAQFVIEDALAALSGATAPLGISAAPTPVPARVVWRHPLPLGLATLILVLAIAVVWSFARTPEPADREPRFLSVMLPPDQEMVPGGLSISPGGRDIVYSAIAEEGPPGPEGNIARLFHRRLGEPASRPLPGTENGWNSMWSPDGAWVAFISPADLTLKKVALDGGGAVHLAGVPWWGSALGTGSWTDPAEILLGDTTGPVRRVPAAGGEPEVVVPRSALVEGEEGTETPRALPAGGGTLFSTVGTEGGSLAVWAQGERRTVPLSGVRRPRLFGRFLVGWRAASQNQNDLVAVRFDPVQNAVIGEPVALLSEGGGVVPMSLSETGTLAYRTARNLGQSRYFKWLARAEGALPPLTMDLRLSVVYSPRVSPDGRRVMYFRQDPNGSNRRLLVADLDTSVTRVVATGSHFWAAWTPDGRRAIYQEGPDGQGGAGMSWRPVDGSAPAERLTTSKLWQQPQVVSRDGRWLVYQEAGGLGTRDGRAEDNYDLWLLPLSPRGEPRPLLKTPANERLPHLSPDQRWMAYVSDEGGRDEVWVRAFPEGAAAMQVSQEGGTEPVWAPDGATLYYRDRTGSGLHAVPVTMGAVLQFGATATTAGHWQAALPFGRMYDIRPDGRALLLLPDATLGREIRLVFNLGELIRRKFAAAQR